MAVASITSTTTHQAKARRGQHPKRFPFAHAPGVAMGHTRAPHSPRSRIATSLPSAAHDAASSRRRCSRPASPPCPTAREAIQVVGVVVKLEQRNRLGDSLHVRGDDVHEQCCVLTQTVSSVSCGTLLRRTSVCVPSL